RWLDVTPVRFGTTPADTARYAELRWELEQHIRLERLIADAAARAGGGSLAQPTVPSEQPVWDAALRELMPERGRSQYRVARLLASTGALHAPVRYRLLKRLIGQPRTPETEAMVRALTTVYQAELRRMRRQAARPYGPVPAEFATPSQAAPTGTPPTSTPPLVPAPVAPAAPPAPSPRRVPVVPA